MSSTEHGQDGHATGQKRVTQRRLDANRRNARRSTGPRTAAGKLRSSRNALKHGLCAAAAIPPCEDAPTFSIFLNELQEELQPVSIMQKTLFPQIANLIWRLRRLPEAQADIFQHELEKSADGETLSPSQIIARRFSDDPSNGFALLDRYERGTQAMLLRMLNQYYKLKKDHPTTPSRPGDRVEPQFRPAAPSKDQMQRQVDAFDRRKAELELHVPPRSADERAIDSALWTIAQQKRTQTKPTEKRDSGPKTRKCRGFSRAPVTKRSQGERAQGCGV